MFPSIPLFPYLTQAGPRMSRGRKNGKAGPWRDCAFFKASLLCVWGGGGGNMWKHRAWREKCVSLAGQKEGPRPRVWTPRQRGQGAGARDPGLVWPPACLRREGQALLPVLGGGLRRLQQAQGEETRKGGQLSACEPARGQGSRPGQGLEGGCFLWSTPHFSCSSSTSY